MKAKHILTIAAGVAIAIKTVHSLFPTKKEGSEDTTIDKFDMNNILTGRCAIVPTEVLVSGDYFDGEAAKVFMDILRESLPTDTHIDVMVPTQLPHTPEAFQVDFANAITNLVLGSFRMIGIRCSNDSPFTDESTCLNLINLSKLDPTDINDAQQMVEFSEQIDRVGREDTIIACLPTAISIDNSGYNFTELQWNVIMKLLRHIKYDDFAGDTMEYIPSVRDTLTEAEELPLITKKHLQAVAVNEEGELLIAESSPSTSDIDHAKTKEETNVAYGKSLGIGVDDIVTIGEVEGFRAMYNAALELVSIGGGYGREYGIAHAKEMGLFDKCGSIPISNKLLAIIVDPRQFQMDIIVDTLRRSFTHGLTRDYVPVTAKLINSDVDTFTILNVGDIAGDFERFTIPSRNLRESDLAGLSEDGYVIILGKIEQQNTTLRGGCGSPAVKEMRYHLTYIQGEALKAGMQLINRYSNLVSMADNEKLSRIFTPEKKPYSTTIKLREPIKVNPRVQTGSELAYFHDEYTDADIKEFNTLATVLPQPTKFIEGTDGAWGNALNNCMRYVLSRTYSNHKFGKETTNSKECYTDTSDTSKPILIEREVMNKRGKVVEIVASVINIFSLHSHTVSNEEWAKEYQSITVDLDLTDMRLMSLIAVVPGKVTKTNDFAGNVSYCFDNYQWSCIKTVLSDMVNLIAIDKGKGLIKIGDHPQFDKSKVTMRQILVTHFSNHGTKVQKLHPGEYADQVVWDCANLNISTTLLKQFDNENEFMDKLIRDLLSKIFQGSNGLPTEWVPLTTTSANGEVTLTFLNPEVMRDNIEKFTVEGKSMVLHDIAGLPFETLMIVSKLKVTDTSDPKDSVVDNVIDFTARDLKALKLGVTLESKTCEYVEPEEVEPFGKEMFHSNMVLRIGDLVKHREDYIMPDSKAYPADKLIEIMTSVTGDDRTISFPLVECGGMNELDRQVYRFYPWQWEVLYKLIAVDDSVTTFDGISIGNFDGTFEVFDLKTLRGELLPTERTRELIDLLPDDLTWKGFDALYERIPDYCYIVMIGSIELDEDRTRLDFTDEQWEQIISRFEKLK